MAVALSQELRETEQKEAIERTKTINDKIHNFYPKAVRLGIRLRIEQLSDIDTVSQTYTVRCVQVTDWQASDDDITNYNKDKENFVPSRIIKVLCVNAVSETGESTVYNQFKHKDGKIYNVRMNINQITFTESFECHNFPFDVQDLSFVYDADRGIDEVIFVPSRCNKEMMYINMTYLALCDWDIVHYDVTSQFIDWGELRTGHQSDLRSEKHPDVTSAVYFRVQVERKAFGFFMRSMLWMFLLSFCGFYIFAFKTSNISDRLAFAVGLVFAIVAFQFILSAQIPNLPYLTIVDKYNLAVFIFILIIALESVIVGWKDGDFWDHDVAETMDYVFSAFMFIAYLLLHIGFMVYVFKKRRFEKNKIGMTFEETHAPPKLGVCFSSEMHMIPWKGPM
eukprot:556368_1